MCSRDKLELVLVNEFLRDIVAPSPTSTPRRQAPTYGCINNDESARKESVEKSLHT